MPSVPYVRSLLPAALAAVLALGTSPEAVSQAGAARAVGGRDLPTIRQVAAIYPVLAGGSRDVYRDGSLSVIARDCLSYAAGPDTRSGAWASYDDASGESPYVYGGENVGVFVYEFGGRAGAHRALRTIRRKVVRCLGTHREPGFLRTRALVDVPRIGDDRKLAWREYQRSVGGGGEVFHDRFLEIWTRTGRHLVNVRSQKELSRPSTERLVRLARVATRAVG